MEILHQRDVQAFSLIPQRLRVRRPAHAEAGVLKCPPALSAVVRQLAKRRAGRRPVGLAQIEMGIQVDNDNPLVREGVQHAATVRPRGFVSAAKDQRAHPGPLA